MQRLLLAARLDARLVRNVCRVLMHSANHRFRELLLVAYGHRLQIKSLRFVEVPCICARHCSTPRVNRISQHYCRFSLDRSRAVVVVPQHYWHWLQSVVFFLDLGVLDLYYGVLPYILGFCLILLVSWTYILNFWTYIWVLELICWVLGLVFRGLGLVISCKSCNLM